MKNIKLTAKSPRMKNGAYSLRPTISLDTYQPPEEVTEEFEARALSEASKQIASQNGQSSPIDPRWRNRAM